MPDVNPVRHGSGVTNNCRTAPIIIEIIFGLQTNHVSWISITGI